VTKRVLSREHTIEDHRIQTTLKRTLNEPLGDTAEELEELSSSEESGSDDGEAEDPEELCSVQVKELSPTTTQDSIQNYFENKKKSKGGPVRKVELKSTLNMAIVVFRFEEGK
jgi:hypothetical protein